MKILYFAWIRERVGRETETVDLPGNVSTVEQLLCWLAGRGENYAHALGDSESVRVALDQEHCEDFSATLQGVREVALFPPMTGG